MSSEERNEKEQSIWLNKSKKGKSQSLSGPNGNSVKYRKGKLKKNPRGCEIELETNWLTKNAPQGLSITFCIRDQQVNK